MSDACRDRSRWQQVENGALRAPMRVLAAIGYGIALVGLSVPEIERTTAKSMTLAARR